MFIFLKRRLQNTQGKLQGELQGEIVETTPQLWQDIF